MNGRTALLCLAAWCYSTGAAVFSQDAPGMSPADSVKPRKFPPGVELPDYTITGKELSGMFDRPAIETEGAKPLDIRLQSMTVGERESTNVRLGGIPKEAGRFVKPNEGFSGKVIAGMGSYTTPDIEGWAGTTSAKSDILMRAHYRSTEGESVNKDYRALSTALSGGLYLPESEGMFSGGRLNLDAAFQNDVYRLYGSSTPSQSRTLSRVNGSFSLHTNYSQGGFLNAAIHYDGLVMKDVERSRESYAGAELAVADRIGKTLITVEGSMWKDFYSSASRMNDPVFGEAGISLRYFPVESLELMAAGTLYVFHGSEGEGKTVIYPKAGTVWNVQPGFMLYSKFEPYVQRTTLSALTETNPYVVNDITLQHAEYFNNFTFGGEITIARVLTLAGSVTYKKAWNYPVFFDQNNTHLWRVAYFGTERILVYETALYADFSDDDEIGITIRNSSNLNYDTNEQLPYFPAAVLGLSYRHTLASRLAFGTNVKFVGRQFTDIGNTGSVASFVVWDAKVEYFIVRRLSAGLSVENILDKPQHWWENYYGDSRRVLLSVGFTW